MSRFLLTAAVGFAGASLAGAGVAHAQSNGSFESGDLTGWSASDATYVSVETSTVGIGNNTGVIWTPTDGQYFARLTVGGGDGTYTMLSQEFALDAGSVVEFDVYFDTADYAPYFDDGFVELVEVSSGAAEQLYFQSVSTVGDYGYDGWTAVSHAVANAGTYRLRAGVRNVGDNGIGTNLGIDNVRSNAAPTATDDSYTVAEDGVLSVAAPGLLGNDDDFDGDTLTAAVASQPSSGSVVINADGSFDYAPGADFHGTDDFTYQIADGNGETATATVTVTVTSVNDVPTFTSTPTTGATEDQTYSYTVEAHDNDFDFLQFSASSLPSWLTLTDNLDGTATLEGTPSNADVGDHDIDIEVDDSSGGTATQSFTISVQNVNDAPTFTSTPETDATEDQTYDYAITAADLDGGDTLTISATGLPAWLSLSDNGDGTASLSGTPANADVGDYSIELTVSDSASDTDTQSFTLSVQNVNDAPTFASAPETDATEDQAYSYAITASDIDAADSLTITASSLPAWLSLTDNGDGTASLSGTPANADVGDYSIDLEVQDTAGATDTQSFTVSVENVNDAPTFASTAETNATEDQAYSYSVTTDDVDAADTLTISATGLPAWLSLSDNGDGTASLSGTPANADVGDHSIELTVSDSAGETDTQSFTLTVQNVNDAPTFTSTPVTSATQDQAYSYTVTTDDVDTGDTLAISASTLPAWLTLTDNFDGTATLEGTPTNEHVGDHDVELMVSDAASDSATQAFTVTVQNVNDAPVFVAPTPADADVLAAVEAQALTFTLQADDPDSADTLTYDVTTLPAGASIDASSGAFSWTPTWDQAGTYTLDLSVSDGALSDERQISVEVSFIDDDADEVPDTWEGDNGLDPATPDSDGDNILDTDEIGDDHANPVDTDQDGTIDALDEDSDDDGILDIDEAGDEDLATEPVDTDQDGTADFRDTDSDADGVEDGADNCPTLENADQADADQDGEGDVCDEDNDGDGVADVVEEDLGLDPSTSDSDLDNIADGEELGDDHANPVDTDQDGTIDALDEDSDDDGILDIDEAGDDDLATEAVDTDQDGTPDYQDTDSDGDDVSDTDDNCRLVENTDQADTDGNGEGDACDGDADGDGVEDDADNCPLVENADQADLDADDVGDECDSDVDGDETDNDADNCLLTPNADQANLDGDEFGDACDDDADGDEVDDEADNCPDVDNADQADADEDGIGDACDETPEPETRTGSSGAAEDGCGCTSTGSPSAPTSLMLVLFGLVALRLRSRRNAA